MIKGFTERCYHIDFKKFPVEKENFFPNKGHLPLPLQLILSQKQQQQQYITNTTAYQLLKSYFFKSYLLQVTFFARNVNKIADF